MNQAKLRTVFAASALFASQVLVAQTAQQTATSKDSATAKSQDETIELSPFLVEATQDEGYQAVNTLAGTRVRTDLRDVASSISVVTSKFLQDTGARNAQDLLVYTTNTEIGGVGGNFGGLGNSNGLSENSALLHPNQNTRVRGLDAADNTRDYFLTDIPWDSYNVDRIDLQRGPNSILFGVGSPAGIVNSQTVIADLHKDSFKVENRFDQFGSIRDSADANVVLLKDMLSIRVAGLDDDTKYRQKPAFNHDKRLFGALRFDPKLFGESAHTSIRMNFETGTINANRPRDLAPMDDITPYFAQSSLNPKDSTEPTPYKISVDPWAYQSTIITGTTANNTTLGLYGKPENWNPWLVAAMARLGSADPVFWYNSNSSSPFRIQQSNIDSMWALAKDGTIDKTIDGLPFAHPVQIQGYNTYTKNAEQRAAALGLADPYPGAQKNYYKDKSLTDPSIFDFYNLLIDGPNKMEREGWHAYDLNVSQTFFDNRLGFEVVWDKQMYHARQETNLSDTPFISVDINKNLTVLPDIAAYSSLPNGFGGTGAVANPDYGRAFVGSSGHYGNHSEQTTRNDYRVTTFGELRASDFFGQGWLANLLGRHDLNVLISRDERKEDDRDYLRYATDINWATSNNETTSITQGFRNVDWITYLSGDLSGASSAANAHIGNITATQSPSGTQTVQYFNSHWKPSTNPSDPGYVDPAAVWPSAYYGGDSTQSENPANYVGWTTTSVSFLNADQGNLDQLYYDGSKVKNVVNTQGFTWQGYLWDDAIVPTFGYRKDKVRTYSAVASTDPTTGVANEDYPYSVTASSQSEGISRSYGLVLHTPKFIKNKLPYGTDISLTFDQSSNFRAENRVDFQGNPVPNAQGKTRELGLVISTLDERLTFKVTKYKTTVYNADLSGDPASSTLGANTYWLWAAQAWGIASALTDELGLQNKAPGASWYWDWASNDLGYNSAGQQILPSGQFPRPAAAAAIDAKEQAAADAWIANMPSQSFFDAYGLPVNVAKIKAGDYADAIGGGWQAGSIGSIQPAGAGRINGLYPVGTIDNVSKGYEFELTAKPLHNWDITINASKTTASRTHLSETLSAYIESEHQILAGPAGDLRTWWAGDTSGTFRNNFNGNIYSAYLFQLEQDGQSAPEVHPWAVNAVTNYSFDQGWSKGFNVGGGFRWQDRAILGYGLINAPTETDPNNVKLNINDPLYGPSQSHFDFWLGYQRKLTRKITWRIQANIRNVGEKVHLEAISVEPDGTPAAMRIVEGQTWTLTNTFTF